MMYGKYGKYQGAMTDEIYQPLFDSVRIKTGPINHQFFANPVGQCAGQPPHVNTHEDTNMYLAGQLPMGQQFYCTGVGVYFVPNVDGLKRTARDDISETLFILGLGYLQFRVQNRVYLGMAPLGSMPPPFPMYWAYDEPKLKKLLSPSKAIGDGYIAYKPGGGFQIVPIYIDGGQSFGVRVQIDNFFELSHWGKLGVMLDGRLIRQAI